MLAAQQVPDALRTTVSEWIPAGNCSAPAEPGISIPMRFCVQSVKLQAIGGSDAATSPGHFGFADRDGAAVD